MPHLPVEGSNDGFEDSNMCGTMDGATTTGNETGCNKGCIEARRGEDFNEDLTHRMLSIVKIRPAYATGVSL